jgi:hypothetical protein
MRPAAGACDVKSCDALRMEFEGNCMWVAVADALRDVSAVQCVTSFPCFSDTWAKYFVLLRKRMKFQGSATWYASLPQPTSFSPLPPPPLLISSPAAPHRVSTQDKP